MAVKIRLKRMGKIRAPYYRIVVADSRTKRDGRVIEEIGKYHPTENPSFIEVKSDRAQYWLSVGAQPTEQVAALLKLTGDWGIFKGDKNAVSTVKVKEPKPVFQIDAKKKPVLVPKAEKAPVKVEVATEEAVAEAVAVDVVVEALAEAIVEEAIIEAIEEAVVEEIVAEVVADAVAEAEEIVAAAEEAAGKEQA
ncbi:MAG: 30S ribosomal protein S16 [Actinomycetales bacterium]|nr:30S ribosomal protein S16 [Actinomycetales bacterium]